MTYNIRIGAGGSKLPDLSGIPENLERIAEFLEDSKVDLIFLQEVDQNTARSQRMDQASLLAERLGFHHAFSPAMNFDDGAYGIALLSRYPILASESTPLPVPSQPGHEAVKYTEPRVLQQVDIDVAGKRVCLFNTHLGLSPGQRKAQLEVIHTKTAMALSSCPVILGGDFNVHSIEEFPEEIRTGLIPELFDETQEHPQWRSTFPVWSPDQRLDFFMASPRPKKYGAQVIPVDHSDHFPVLGWIEF